MKKTFLLEKYQLYIRIKVFKFTKSDISVLSAFQSIVVKFFDIDFSSYSSFF